MKNNLIAHNQEGSADKVYMACVQHSGASYVVIGKWGRRGRQFQTQIKLNTDSQSAAYAEQRRVFEAKLKKGYVDIEDSNYDGPVTPESLEEYLEDDPVVTPRPKKKPKPKKKPVEKPKDMIVKCVDNAGMEDRFDLEIEYVAEPHDDDEMLWVYDKFGERKEYFGVRFEEVNE